MALFASRDMVRAKTLAKQGRCQRAHRAMREVIKDHLRFHKELPSGFAWQRTRAAVAAACGTPLGRPGRRRRRRSR